MPFTTEELQKMRTRRTFQSALPQEQIIQERKQEEAPRGFLPRLLDYINRPSYASASFSNAMTSGQTFEESIRAAGRGFMGEERMYYSDVLDNMGVKNQYVKAVGGFVLDVALDPLNAISLFGKQGTKLGLTFLNSQGDDLLKAAMKQSSKLVKTNIAAGMTKEVAEQAAKEAIERTVLKAAMKDSSKYVAKKFSVKFLGQEIPTISGGLNELATKLDKVTDPFYKTGPLKWLGESFVGKEFEIKHLKGLTPEAKSLMALSRQQSQRAILKGSQQAFEGALKMAKEVPELKDREKIAHALEASFQKGAKPLREILNDDRLFESAKKVEGLLTGIRDEEIRRGVLSGAFKDKKILPHYYKKYLEGAIGKDVPRPIMAMNKHMNTRMFATMDDAIKAGWQPIEDYAVSLSLRDAYSKKLLATDDHVKRMLIEIGEPLNVKSATFKEMIKTNRVPEGMGIYVGRGDARFYPMYNGKKTQVAQKQINKLMGDILNSQGARAFGGGELLQDFKLTPLKNIIKKAQKGKKAIPQLPMYLLPKDVAGMLNQASPYMTSDKGISAFQKFSDTVMNVWKTSVTSLWPGFHSRNAMSNLWSCALGGMGIQDAGRFQDAFKLQRYSDLISKGEDVADFVINLGGKDYNASELVKIAKEKGILGRGWFGKEMAGTLEEGITRQVKGTTFDGLTGKERMVKAVGMGTEKARVIGTSVEDNARLGLFLDSINKGKSFDDAAFKTKKFLFDYGDLTDFEKKVMKKWIPFYTWTRKNLPLQVEQVLQNPQMFGRVQKAKGEIETLSDKPDEKYMPPWMKEKELHTRLPIERKGKPLYMSFDMSFQDLAKLNLGKPVDVLRESLSMLRPDVKAFIEIALNYNTFYGRTMTDPDLPQTTQLKENVKKEILSNLRAVGAFKKLTDEEVPVLHRALDFFLGFKMQEYDIRKERKWYNDRMEKRKRAIDRYEKANK